jgi:hypothetical protein
MFSTIKSRSIQDRRNGWVEDENMKKEMICKVKGRLKHIIACKKR